MSENFQLPPVMGQLVLVSSVSGSMNALFQACECTVLVILHESTRWVILSISLHLKVNCLTWSPPGHRVLSPRAKPLCLMSSGKSLRGPAAARPPPGHRRASPTTSPPPPGVETRSAWPKVGAALTPLVSARPWTTDHIVSRSWVLVHWVMMKQPFWGFFFSELKVIQGFVLLFSLRGSWEASHGALIWSPY